MRRAFSLVLLLLPCSLACNGYGSTQSIATDGNRLPGTAVAGLWHCPASAGCDDDRESHWVDVRRHDTLLEIRWTRAAIRDSFTGYDETGGRLHIDRLQDTIATTFTGHLLQLGRDTILELTSELPRQSFETLPVVPVYSWVRVHLERNRLRLEYLNGERLIQRLTTHPGDMRPFRIVRSPARDATPDVIVLALGSRSDVERFVRRAFGDSALVVDEAIVLERGPAPARADLHTAMR
jgi:hypothetical protein